MPDFAVSAGGVVGVAGVVVVWASACDPVRTADEATNPNAAAYPNKARAFRRQTPLGSELSSIFVLPVFCPEASHLASRAWRLIRVNRIVRIAVARRLRKRDAEELAVTSLGVPAAARARDQRNKPLPPRPNAIDATICIATGVMTDRSARHRTGPEHDACPGNASHRIFNVLAVYDRVGWGWIESETCKPQQGASSNPGNCR